MYKKRKEINKKISREYSLILNKVELDIVCIWKQGYSWMCIFIRNHILFLFWRRYGFMNFLLDHHNRLWPLDCTRCSWYFVLRIVEVQ